MSDRTKRFEEDLKKAESQLAYYRTKVKNIKQLLEKSRADELVEAATASGLTLDEAKEFLRTGVKPVINTSTASPEESI